MSVALTKATPPAPQLRCRVIEEHDLDAVIALLCEGFPARPESYWRTGLRRHLARDLPQECPRIGYMLEHEGKAVGVLLTLGTHTDFRDEDGVRCNVSSWYVDPRFRSHATLLDRMSSRRDITVVNISPAPHTWAIQEARRFERYCRGQMIALPLLGKPTRGIRLREVKPDDPLTDLPDAERRLVRDHQSYGCLCLVWTDRAGSRPLVFQRNSIGLGGRLPWFRLPVAQLIYCRRPTELPRVAAALGRYLLRRHRLVCVLMDAVGAIPGLRGLYVDERNIKFARGPRPMPLGDLAYTELVLFGP